MLDIGGGGCDGDIGGTDPAMVSPATMSSSTGVEDETGPEDGRAVPALGAAEGGHVNFGMVLRRSARTFPDKAAVRFEDRQLTYAQLYERACRLSNVLL